MIFFEKFLLAELCDPSLGSYRIWCLRENEKLDLNGEQATSRENRHIAPRRSRTTPIQQIIGADSNPLTCTIYKEERVQKSRKYTVLTIKIIDLVPFLYNNTLNNALNNATLLRRFVNLIQIKLIKILVRSNYQIKEGYQA